MTTKYLAVTRLPTEPYCYDTILIDICDTPAAATMAIEAFKASLNQWDRKLYSDFKIIEKYKGSVAILQSFVY